MDSRPTWNPADCLHPDPVVRLRAWVRSQAASSFAWAEVMKDFVGYSAQGRIDADGNILPRDFALEVER